MDCDVIIAGGGPVGLMLAGELRLHGVAVVVLERLTELDPTIKAGSVNIPTMEALYRRGLMPRIKKAQAETLEAFGMRGHGGPRPVGHFAGIFMWSDRLDEAEFPVEGPAAGLGEDRLQLLLGDEAEAGRREIGRAHV